MDHIGSSTSGANKKDNKHDSCSVMVIVTFHQVLPGPPAGLPVSLWASFTQRSVHEY